MSLPWFPSSPQLWRIHLNTLVDFCGKEIDFSSRVLPRWVSWGLTHHFPFSLFPIGEVTGGLFSPEVCALGGGTTLASLFRVSELLFYFGVGVLQRNVRNLYLRNYSWEDFCKALYSMSFCPHQHSLGFPQLHLSRGSCWCHSPYLGLSAYYLMHKWARLLPGPLVYGTWFHNSHRGTFVYKWMLKFSCYKGGIEEGGLTPPLWFCHTQSQFYVFLPSSYTFYFLVLSVWCCRERHFCLIPDLSGKALTYH